jgi:hypothetical protein
LLRGEEEVETVCAAFFAEVVARCVYLVARRARLEGSQEVVLVGAGGREAELGVFEVEVDDFG